MTSSVSIPDVTQISKPTWRVDGVDYDREVDAHRAAFIGYVAALVNDMDVADILADNHEALFRVLGRYVEVSRRQGKR